MAAAEAAVGDDLSRRLPSISESRVDGRSYTQCTRDWQAAGADRAAVHEPFNQQYSSLIKRNMVRNKILIFGDSITYGQRDLEMGGWVNRLRLALAHDSSITSCHVFNMGISGQTTTEILERLSRECKGRVLDDANNIIVIAAGINDAQIKDGTILNDEDAFKSNVRALIEEARSFTDKVIYLGLTPVDDARTSPVLWDRSMAWKSALIERYDTIISEICSEMGVRYVYVYDQIDPATNEDGLHPSEAGHVILAEIMGNVIYDYLKKASPIAAAKAEKSMGGAIKSFFKTLFS